MRMLRHITSLCALFAAASFGVLVAAPAERAADADQPATTHCACELRSWVVAGRGRHLLLDIDCPPPHEGLADVVEFGAAIIRIDYQPPPDPRLLPRLAKATSGVRVRPIFGDGAERTEARWTITPEQARILRRDRLFEAQYIMLTTNSNAALRAAAEEAGLTLPDHVLRGGGPRGEFPGIDFDPGPEAPPERWPALGLPHGPVTDRN